ncbi:MAG: hypothetical protein Q8O38_00760 [Sulfurimicrobium sp.]|nr:hypothetical protein [Sulfurimicrobium sp.]
MPGTRRLVVGLLGHYRKSVYNLPTLLIESARMAETAFCYHCRQHHPKTEMRQIETKAGKRWRCIRSIEATRQGQAAREAYGRQVSEMNKSEAQSRARLAKPIVVV